MAEIVNLNRARKDRARRERKEQAAANRRLFGRTKGEKTADADAKERTLRDIDGKRLEPDCE
jgi:hypothetical protein